MHPTPHQFKYSRNPTTNPISTLPLFEKNMELRCAARSIMLGIERPGPSVEAFLTLAELRYLQKARGFLYGV
jgi:hypothetical protein